MTTEQMDERDRGLPESAPRIDDVTAGDKIIPGTRAAARAAVEADAADRAKRTFWQNLPIDALVIVGVTAAQAGEAVVNGWNPETLLDPAAWALLGLTIGKTALLSGISYVARLKIPPRSE